MHKLYLVIDTIRDRIRCDVTVAHLHQYTDGECRLIVLATLLHQHSIADL